MDNFLNYLTSQVSHQLGHHFYHDQLKPRGIQLVYWWVLCTLGDDDGLTVGEIANSIMYEQPVATRVIARMEQEELVERQHSKQDRRKVSVFLTKRGRQLLKELQSAALNDEKSTLRSINEKTIDQLKKTLRNLLEELDN